jgi:hypothetical protein
MATKTMNAVEIYTLEEGRRYVALSASALGTAYELILHSDYPGDISCTCKGYEFRQHCKHATAVQSRLERTREQARQQLGLAIAELYH